MNWNSKKIIAFDGLSKVRDNKLSSILNVESEFPKPNPFHNGDRDLRAANIEFDYTDDEVKSILKANSDPCYLSSCLMPMMGVSIKLRDYQEEALNNYYINRFNLVVNSRQTGMTAVLALQALHFVLGNNDKVCSIFSHKLSRSKELLDKVRNFYKQLPYYIKPGIIKWDDDSIVFDNGCYIKVHSSKQTSVVGYGIDFLILDDFSFYKNASLLFGNLAATLYSKSNGRIVIASCPSGDDNNFFNKMVTSTTYNSIYKQQWIYWNQVPGRDEAWKQNEISMIGSVEDFMLEYELLFKGSPKWAEYMRDAKIDRII